MPELSWSGPGPDNSRLAALCCSVTVLLGACADPADPLPTEARSSAAPCGTMQAVLRGHPDGSPEEIGLSFSGDLLLCLFEHGEELEWVIPLAGQGSVGAAPFDHAFVVWNSAGHEPPFIYDLPHLDFHFHMVPVAEREQYCPADNSDFTTCMNVPAPGEAPLGYIPGPAEPGHGVHWVDLSSPEFMGQTFTQTLIYGSYDGDMVFIEPMITTEHLLGLAEGDLETPIAEPMTVPATGWYPGSYVLRYLATTGQYEIILRDFSYREGG